MAPKFVLLPGLALTLVFEDSIHDDFVTIEDRGRLAGSLSHLILFGYLKLYLKISDRGLECPFETADDLQGTQHVIYVFRKLLKNTIMLTHLAVYVLIKL